jgi:hypothetical protein
LYLWAPIKIGKKSAIIGIFKGTVAVAYRGCTISALKPEWVAAESRMRLTMLLQQEFPHVCRAFMTLATVIGNWRMDAPRSTNSILTVAITQQQKNPFNTGLFDHNQ